MKKETINSGRMLLGSIVLIVGIGLFLQNVFSWFTFNYAWPFIIIAVGIYLVAGQKK